MVQSATEELLVNIRPGGTMEKRLVMVGPPPLQPQPQDRKQYLEEASKLRGLGVGPGTPSTPSQLDLNKTWCR